MPDLELKIHPPIVLGFCGVLTWIISRMAQHPVVADDNLLLTIAIVSALAGVALGLSALYEFYRVKTTIDPAKPVESSSLVTSGVYQITRNPMYLGSLLILVGWVIYVGNVYGAISLLVFVSYITRFQIRPEERIMASKFGAAYDSYCVKVRRWI